MKALPPLMILCYGGGYDNAFLWYARVLKEAHGKKWKRVDPRDGREVTATTAREAVRKAITLYGKEPRTCRRCGRTWECKRTREIHVCPQCQTKRAKPERVLEETELSTVEADMVAFVVNRDKETP